MKYSNRTAQHLWQLAGSVQASDQFFMPALTCVPKFNAVNHYQATSVSVETEIIHFLKSIS